MEGFRSQEDIVKANINNQFATGKHYELVKVVRDGKTFFQKRLVGTDQVISDGLETGDYYNVDDLKLQFTKYSDKAFLVTGDTYQNLAFLKDIKEKIGSGVYNKTLGGWIFPSAKHAEIAGLIAEKADLSTIDGDIQKENALAVKNAVEPGTTIENIGEKKVVESVIGVEGKSVYTVDNKGKKEDIAEKDIAIVPKPDVTEVINEVSQVTRTKAGKEVFGKAEGEQSVGEKKDEDVTKRQEAQLKEFTTKSGEVIHALDYSFVKPSDIQLVDPDTILEKPKPYWCPDINEKAFTGYKDDKFVFDYIKLDDDRIILALNGYKDKGKTDSFYDKTNAKDEYAVISLDQLVGISDYYTKKRKANIAADKVTGIERNLELVRKMDDIKLTAYKAFAYTRLSAKQKQKYSPEQWEVLDKESKIQEIPSMANPVISIPSAKRIKQLADDTMFGSNFRMYKRFTDNNYVVPTNGRFNPFEQVAMDYQSIREAIKWKRQDLEIQREENHGSYEKGSETSYGSSGTKDTILNSHGVMIKSQNGKEVSLNQTEQIKTALTEVYNSFGDRSKLAKNANLRISHSGDKLMYARKALGLYVPSMNAIGVSDNQEHGKFGFTLAHEFAHFIDNSVGKKQGRNYASDDYNSSAGKIATQFRKNMNVASESGYVNRTCECFARAMEQYHAMKTVGEDAIKSKVSGLAYHKSPEHVSKETFNATIKPLIEQFFKENDHLLKAEIDNLRIVEAYKILGI